MFSQITISVTFCCKQLDLFSFRTRLRHMLEWSCLYRVTLLLSKINDDSDLDAEAAILYGKVGTYVDAKCLSRIGT